MNASFHRDAPDGPGTCIETSACRGHFACHRDAVTRSTIALSSLSQADVAAQQGTRLWMS